MKSKLEVKTAKVEKEIEVQNSLKGGEKYMTVNTAQISRTGKIAMLVSSLLIFSLVAISLITAYNWTLSVVNNWQEIDFARTNPELVKAKREEWQNILVEAKNEVSKKEAASTTQEENK